MVSSLIVTLWLFGCGSEYPAAKAIMTQDRQIVFLAGETDPAIQPVINVLQVDESRLPARERFEVASRGQTRRSGPMSWGVRGDCYHYVVHSEMGGRWIAAINHPFESRRVIDRELRENRPPFAEQRQMDLHSGAYGRRIWVLENFIDDLGGRGVSYARSNLFFDLAYTAPNHVTLIVVRNGQLRWWTWNKPEETDWVDRGTIETRVEGVFRIVQAGADMYLVDGRGWVFSSPDQGARLLGTIAGWGQPRDGETLFLLEEQKHGKIAVVKVAEGKTTVLEALVEAEAREDFMTTIDDEDLDRAIIRMAAALREEEQGGK